MDSRDENLQAAIRWCGASVAWAAVAGVTGLLAGLAGGVIALVGFGADSITDGVASAVLVWRFSRERSGASDQAPVERRAARVVGAILLLIGAYVSVVAVLSLARQSRPDGSTVGVVLTAASLLVLPGLARAKLRLAVSLESPGLRGDGVLSLAGALLALVTLVSLLLNEAFGWWWPDAIAAILIAAFMLREGATTVRASGRAAPAAGVARGAGLSN